MADLVKGSANTCRLTDGEKTKLPKDESNSVSLINKSILL